MEAIIEVSGFQYEVKENAKVKVPKLKGSIGDKVKFPIMMLIDGNKPFMGDPYVKNAECEAEILRTAKSAKKLRYKYKSKKNYRRKGSHRQWFTEILINSIKSHV
ncbi:MAG: 50S ribosomal protein L21 [bacterium]|nr:50S ribosomal protein L21 [bacterium]